MLIVNLTKNLYEKLLFFTQFDVAVDEKFLNVIYYVQYVGVIYLANYLYGQFFECLGMQQLQFMEK